MKRWLVCLTLALAAPVEACEVSQAFVSSASSEEIVACIGAAEASGLLRRDTDQATLLHLLVRNDKSAETVDRLRIRLAGEWRILPNAVTDNRQTALHEAARSTRCTEARLPGDPGQATW